MQSRRACGTVKGEERMKNKILIMLLASLCILASGCETNDTLQLTEFNAMADQYGTYEWVSPDGVHYWVVCGNYRYGIAPRYDNDGNLIIDKKGGQKNDI